MSFSLEILSYINEMLAELVGNIEHYVSGASNLRIASIVLMVLAFTMFVFLIAMINVKSAISFMKMSSSSGSFGGDNNAYPTDDSLGGDWEKDFPDRRLEELYAIEEEKKIKVENTKKEKMEALRRQETKVKKEKSRTETAEDREIGKRPVVQLDWEKSKIQELESAEVTVNGEIFKYKPAKKSLNELTGLVIDMLSRGVDELKIAQTMMLRTQGEVSEDEILQTVDAVRDFIALSVNKRFDVLRKNKELPDEKDAITRLANGDVSYSLGLLEALMDSNISTMAKTTSEQKRENLIKETSFAAIMFGNLASLSDTRLATESFELAIDLSPNNVNAWGRLADMHYKISEHQKAIEAYKKLLELSDEEIYPRQVANAHQKLAQYYFEQGDNSKAAKLYNSSKKYYDYIGINKNLEKRELEIVEIIESRQKEELQNAIVRIFGSKKWQLSYA